MDRQTSVGYTAKFKGYGNTYFMHEVWTGCRGYLMAACRSGLMRRFVNYAFEVRAARCRFLLGIDCPMVQPLRRVATRRP
jgi:hypothetical protein